MKKICFQNIIFYKRLILCFLLCNNYLIASCDCSQNVENRYQQAINKIDPNIEKIEKELKEYNKKLDEETKLKKNENKLLKAKLDNELSLIVLEEKEIINISEMNKKMNMQIDLKKLDIKQKINLIIKNIFNN